MRHMIRRGVATTLIASFAAVGAALGGAPTTQATVIGYCTYYNLGSPDTCEGARHSLDSNYVNRYNGGTYLCAGAHDVNHNNYASFSCSYNQTYHCYSGANLLYPLAYRPAGNSGGQITATEGYGGAPCPA